MLLEAGGGVPRCYGWKIRGKPCCLDTMSSPHKHVIRCIGLKTGSQRGG